MVSRFVGLYGPVRLADRQRAKLGQVIADGVAEADAPLFVQRQEPDARHDLRGGRHPEQAVGRHEAPRRGVREPERLQCAHLPIAGQ